MVKDGRCERPPHSAAFDAIHTPKTYGEYIAYGISQLGSPPILGLFALILVIASLTWATAWPWFGVYLIGAMIAPLLFLIWQVRHGRVTDFDLQLREQRKGSLLVTIASFAITWLVMWIGHAPPLLTAMAGIGAVQWLLVFAITLRWKISVHTTSAAGITVLILRVFGIAAVPLVISIPLIAWSRVKLRRHTLSQTIAGALLGSSIVVGAILVMPAL